MRLQKVIFSEAKDKNVITQVEQNKKLIVASLLYLNGFQLAINKCGNYDIGSLSDLIGHNVGC